MPVHIQFKGWSGKDATAARVQLAKVFKLPGKKSETVFEWIAQGRPWKYSTAVADQKGEQAQAFFKKLGFEVELIPVGAPAILSASPMPSATSPQPVSAPTDRITAEHFEIPGLVWVLEASPDENRQKNDRRLLLIPKTPVLLIVLLSIVTLGMYGVYWFMSRRDAINGLDSQNQLSAEMLKGLFALYGGLLLFNVLKVMGVVSGMDVLLAVVSLVVTILFLVETFKVRRILLDHLDANFSGLKTISGFLTLTLSIIFLQYKINGIHDWYAQEHDEDEELVLRGDASAWVYAILAFVVLPAAVTMYGAMALYNALDQEGLGDIFNPGYELSSYYAACDSYWKDAGDDQECTLEIVADMTFPYTPGSNVKITGSGTRATFHAEAVSEGSEQVFSINGRGEISLGDANESYTITFGNQGE